MPIGSQAKTALHDGLLLVDKPSGITSHDVIDTARQALGTRRVGHTGTLDPLATGLLVLLVGRCTRLLPYVESEPKVYIATIAFGAQTDTDDAAGSVIREAAIPDQSTILAALRSLTGSFNQRPPAYSARKVGGTRAYRAARRGHPLQLEARGVLVHGWSDIRFHQGSLQAVVVCGGGTYIRSLARDLGVLCESAAHLAALRRTRAGSFSVSDAVSMDILRTGNAELLPPLAAVPALNRVALTHEEARHIVHGRPVPASGAGERAALLSEGGELLAIAERNEMLWKPKVVFADA